MRFFSVQLREIIEVPDLEVKFITMKNGKKGAQVEIERSGKKIRLFKILSFEELKTIL